MRLWTTAVVAACMLNPLRCLAAEESAAEVAVIEAHARIFRHSHFGPTANALVQSSMTIFGQHLFITYYDANQHVCVARRPLAGGAWIQVVLPSIMKFEDSHCTPNLGISPRDGRIHLAFGLHVNELRYVMSQPAAATVSDADFKPALFGPEQNFLRPNEPIAQMTYPRFLVGNDQDLLMVWRIGIACHGSLFISAYSSTGWSSPQRIIDGDTGLFRGEAERSPYTTLLQGSDQRLHAVWTWREHPGDDHNHDLNYAFSPDQGITWESAHGAVVGTPQQIMSLDTSGIVAWQVEEAENLANGFGLAEDRSGKLHVVSLKQTSLTDPTPSYWHSTLDHGSWTHAQFPAGFSYENRPLLYHNPQTDDLYVISRKKSGIDILRAEMQGNARAPWKLAYAIKEQYMSAIGMVDSAGQQLLITAQRASVRPDEASTALELITLRLTAP